jgi:hypothetical protein
LLVASLGSCTEPRETGIDGALDRALARWVESEVDDYRWTYSWGGFERGTEAIRVQVVNGGPVSFAQRNGPASVDEARRAGYLLTVDDAFEMFAARMGGETFEATYDPELGYPTSLRSDPDGDTYDDELGFSVIRFVERR